MRTAHWQSYHIFFFILHTHSTLFNGTGLVENLLHMSIQIFFLTFSSLIERFLLYFHLQRAISILLADFSIHI